MTLPQASPKTFQLARLGVYPANNCDGGRRKPCTVPMGLLAVRSVMSYPRWVSLNRPGFPESALRENRHADWRGLTVMVGVIELGQRT
jgi:hypothetical protein